MRRASTIGIIGLLLGCLAPSLTAAPQSAPRRVVTLGVIVPGAPQETRLTALEDGLATVAVRDVGRFGFSPSFVKGEEKTAVVTLFDVSTEPMIELGRVEAPVAGKAVESQTKPAFTIRVISVAQPR